jgi:hypothetical protein
MKTEPIQEFILKDEQNLRIAVAVSEAWPKVRSRITTTFLDRLTTKLVNELPRWATETWETCFEHRYASFQLYKPTWEYYWVNLQFRDWGQNVRLGIEREESLVSDRPFSSDILEAVRKFYPSATQAKWWEASFVLRSPATDWRAPEVLWRIHTDSSFLDSVAEQMVALAKATESILDRLNKKKS